MAPTYDLRDHTVPAAGSAPPVSSKVNHSPATYRMKPALAAGTMGTAGGKAPPLKKPTGPGTAVLLSLYAGVVTGQRKSPAASVALASRPGPTAVALWFKKPQVPPASVSKGTSTLLLTSTTESTIPP